MSMDAEFMEQLRKEFLDEAVFMIEQCEESYLKLEHPECRVVELDKIFRLAHSLKGAGSAVGFTCLAFFAHSVEDCLTILRVSPHFVNAEIISTLLRCGDAIQKRIQYLKSGGSDAWDIETLNNEVKALVKSLTGANIPENLTVAPEALDQMLADETEKSLITVAPAALPVKTAQAPAGAPPSSASASSGSIKIDIDRIENILNVVGELVVIKSQLINQSVTYANDLQLSAIISLMDKTIRDLQDKTLSLRMTPLKNLFLKTQRILRDLSVKLDKPIEFQMKGEETEIDRSMVELLADPLMHIARNALDHGVENNERRKNANKNPKGLIELSSRQVGSKVLITIRDDGAGLNRDKLVKKALEKGVIAAGVDPSTISDQDVYQFIFAPGFSTADQVTDVSGRGVGMDVVKTNIEKLKGSIEIESTPGAGTLFKILLPLTTAITDGMIVQIGDQPCVIPMESIHELVKLEDSSIIEMRSGQKVFDHRGKFLRMVALEKLAHHTELMSNKGIMMVVTAQNDLVSMHVSAVLGQTQVVLKPLAETFENVTGVAGAAILGDGRVAMVLDIDALASQEHAA